MALGIYKFIFKNHMRAREMAQRLEALAALTSLRFNSQHPHSGSQLPETPVPIVLMSFTDLHRGQTHTHGKETYMQAKHSSNNNK